MLNSLSCRTGRSMCSLAFRILVGFLLNKAVMHSWTRWPVSNNLLLCVCVFVCAVSLSLIISVNTRKKRSALLLHANEVWREKGKHFLQNEAILFLIELGQVFHVFLPPQLNVFLPHLYLICGKTAPVRFYGAPTLHLLILPSTWRGGNTVFWSDFGGRKPLRICFSVAHPVSSA